MFNSKKKKKADEKDDFFSVVAKESANSKSDLDSLKTEPEWIDQEPEEGQLSVDVYEDGDNIIVKSTIAGVEPEDVDITINDDLLTIRGERKRERHARSHQYFFQECYWGSFSRSIILPVEVDVKKIDATIKNGILMISLPKSDSMKAEKNIKVKDKN